MFLLTKFCSEEEMDSNCPGGCQGDRSLYSILYGVVVVYFRTPSHLYKGVTSAQ